MALFALAGIIGCGGSDKAMGPSSGRLAVVLDSCATAQIILTLRSVQSGSESSIPDTVAASPDSAVFTGLQPGSYSLGLFGSWPGVSGPYAGLIGNVPTVTVPGRQVFTCTGGRPVGYVVTLQGTTLSGGCLVRVGVGSPVTDGNIVNGYVSGGLSGGPTVFGTGLTALLSVALGQTTSDTLFLPQATYEGAATVFTGYDPGSASYLGYDTPDWIAQVPGSVDLSC